MSPSPAQRTAVNRPRRFGAAAALVLPLIFGLLALSGQVHRVPPLTGPAGAKPSQAKLFNGLLLVYGRHALTAAQVRSVVRAVSGVVTPVYGGELALRSGRSDYPSVPVQALSVDPTSYAAAAQRPSLAHDLATGVVLSRAGAALRKATVGQDVVLMSGRHLRVTAVVDDHVIGGYELATSRSQLGTLAASGASYLLAAQGSDALQTQARIRRSLPGVDLRVKSTTRNGFLSSADSVLTQAQVKTMFGEFAVRTTAAGALRLDSGWRQRWIASTVLPQLGVITCNRLVIPSLRAAMQEITSRGLGSLVHTADFHREGGCWNPRLTRFGAGQLSSHAWGIAVDINVDVNPLGATPVQDPRLVAIMARHGFMWGGRFLRPDGAHFEWVGTSVR